MNRQTVLAYLPRFNYRSEILSDDQTIGEIISEVLTSHKIFARDYDKISPLFDRGSVPATCEAIFDFLKTNVPYRIENANRQTSRSPAGIIELGSGDCKHYAGFIAGVLDSLKRYGKKIDWKYRFASYDLFSQSPKHVFVVVNYNGREIWIDPVLDELDDRSLVPNFFIDKKVSTMALVRMSGFSSDTTAHRYRRPGQQCVSGFFDDLTGGTTDPGIDPGTDPTGDSGGGGIVQAIQQGAQALANFLPAGGLKDWLNSFLKNPVGAVLTFITGRTYTSGDYHLGEVFLRNIIGKADIQNRGQVPDSAVPPAWEFFTAALGIRIVSYDHLDAISQSPAAYFAWMHPTGLDVGVSQQQAERATRIIQSYGFPANQSDERRNMKWDLKGFTAEPYILPIVGITPGQLFTGINPVTGQQFANGIPVSSPGLQTGTSPKIAGLPWWLVVGLGGGLLYSMMKKKRRVPHG